MLRRRDGMMPPGSAGVPPAQVLAQPRPSPPPGSTGNGARTLLRPSPCRSRRQVARCRIAGKLSGTQRDSMRAGRPRSRGAPPPSLLLLKGARAGLPGRSPADAAEPSRLVALRDSSCHLVDHSFFVCFRQAEPALVCGSYKSETIRNRSSLRDLGIPSRLTSMP